MPNNQKNQNIYIQIKKYIRFRGKKDYGNKKAWISNHGADSSLWRYYVQLHEPA